MLLKSLKGLGLTFVEILLTRMEILSLDVKEAKIRFFSVLILGLLAFFFLAFGVILGVFMLIIIFWQTDRLLVMGIIVAALLGCGLILLMILICKLRNGPLLFQGTIAELDRDRETLASGARRSE